MARWRSWVGCCALAVVGCTAPAGLDDASSGTTDKGVRGSGDEDGKAKTGAAGGGGGTREPAGPAPEADPDAGPTAFAWDKGKAPDAAYDGAARALLAGCADASAKLLALEAPVAFFVERRVGEDPELVKSISIATSLASLMPQLGYCARIKNAAQESARAAILTYVKKLSAVYVGGLNTNATSDEDNPGNPINEFQALPVIFGGDMIRAKLSVEDRKVVDDFAKAMESRVATFMNALSAKDDRRHSAWTSMALAVRAYAALAGGDDMKAGAIAAEIDKHVADMFVAPATWKTPGCQNLAAIGSYGSNELQRRDSLREHLYPLGILAQLAALRPGYLSASSLATLDAAIGITKPYVMGIEQHEEFVCTTLTYDQQQRAAGTVGYSGMWDPSSSKESFRFARVALPDVRSWTNRYAVGTYSPWIQVFVAGKGDVTLPE